MPSALSPGDDDLGDVGDEHVAVRLTGGFVRGDRAGRDGTSSDLRLARPVALLALLGVNGRAVQGEAGIPLEVRPLPCAGHRTEVQFAALELALDAGDAGRAVGAQGCDCLVASGFEQPLHALSELWFFLLDRFPRRHGRAAYQRVPAGRIRTARVASSMRCSSAPGKRSARRRLPPTAERDDVSRQDRLVGCPTLQPS